MNTTRQGPGFLGVPKTQKNNVIIQGICFDGEFIRLEGEPVGLAIRQEVFAKWLNVTHYSMYVAGLDTFGGNSFDWYFATFENSFTTKKIQKTIKQYIESQTTFQISYGK
jgi:hypothetical protein